MAGELAAKGGGLPGANVVMTPGIRVVDLDTKRDRLLEAELDRGEASVIQLAVETAETEVLIDERKARRIASSVYGLNVLGTGGLLLRGKRRGIIPQVKPLLEEIRGNGFFF